MGHGLTAEEVLAGQSQGGVPRPRFLKGHEDDGSVQSEVTEEQRKRLAAQAEQG